MIFSNKELNTSKVLKDFTESFGDFIETTIHVGCFLSNFVTVQYDNKYLNINCTSIDDVVELFDTLYTKQGIIDDDMYFEEF